MLRYLQVLTRQRVVCCPFTYLLGEVDIFGPAALHVPHRCVLGD